MTAPTPHDNLVPKVKLGHYIHLIKRTSVQMDKWYVVSRDCYESITSSLDWQLMVHFEPFTIEDSEELARLGFLAKAQETEQLWKLVDLDVWKTIYQFELERKARNDIQRAKAVEFSAYASKKLAYAKNRLMSEWSNTPYEADNFLNMILNPAMTQKAFVDFRVMLNLEDLMGKVVDVKAYCKTV